MLRLAAQVVHAGLETLIPRMEMHGRERSVRGVFHPQVHALTLTDKRTPIRSHVDHVAHGYFPRNLVLVAHVLWNLRQMLYAALVCNDTVFDLF